MSDSPREAIIFFAGDKPMQLADIPTDGALRVTEDQKHIVAVVAKAVHEYRNAAKSLLSGQYSHLKKFAPEHLADPGNILVLVCTDGVVIRYERNSGSSKFVAGWMEGDLRKVAAKLSQGLIRCHASRQFTSTVDKTGYEITLSAGELGTSRQRILHSFRIGFDVVIDPPEHIPAPPHRPFCLASIRNTLEIELEVERVPEAGEDGEGERFLARRSFRLPVGWECVEIYPFMDLDAWKPENARAWAEKDILAAVATSQIREAHFQSLDPNAKARKHYANLLREFKALLDSKPEREEVLQVFLRDRPFLLCPTKTKMWAKLALGAKVTDFVFRDATSDYLLVELERSTHPLFRKDGHARNELKTAMGQITDWKQYIEDNLRTVQNELGLSGISTNPQFLVVIGRSHTLTAENRRKLTTMENVQPKLKIVTYDDLYDNAKAVIENLLGRIWDPVGETQIYSLT